MRSRTHSSEIRCFFFSGPVIVISMCKQFACFNIFQQTAEGEKISQINMWYIWIGTYHWKFLLSTCWFIASNHISAYNSQAFPSFCAKFQPSASIVDGINTNRVRKNLSLPYLLIWKLFMDCFLSLFVKRICGASCERLTNTKSNAYNWLGSSLFVYYSTLKINTKIIQIF